MTTIKEIRAMAEAARAAQTPRQRQQAEDARKLAAFDDLLTAAEDTLALATSRDGESDEALYILSMQVAAAIKKARSA